MERKVIFALLKYVRYTSPLRARTFDQEIVYFLVQDGVNCLLRYAYFIYRVQSPLRHTGNEDGMYRRRSHPSHPADDFF